VRRPQTSVEALAARVGESFVSRWIAIDQSRIDAFAEVTEDRQFIHIDVEAARATPFGGTIAHGFLTLAMLSAMAEDALPAIAGAALGVNYGFDRLRFLAPVPAGARVRGRFTLVGATQRSEREWLMNHEAIVEIEGAERPALAARWLTMVVTAEERA
jgi:acyl dehydratase